MTDEFIRLRGGEYIVTECGKCGVVFTVPRLVYETRRREGGYNFCPNGHERGWRPEGSENGILRRERDRLVQQLAQKDDEITTERRRADAEHAKATKAEGETRRIKKRIGGGVCPDCNRTFADMTRHMQVKHGAPKCEVIPIHAKIAGRTP